MKTTEFKQKAKVGVAGSFINQLMSNNASIPEVGKGATRLDYSDRHAYEVIEVSKDGKTVKLEELDAEHDKNLPGGMGHQNWILKPSGRFTTVVWRHNAWRVKSKRIVFTKEFIVKAESAGFFGVAAYLHKNDPELHQKIYDGDVYPQTVIEGVTHEIFEYSKIKLLFGRKEYYYDWSF